MSATAAVAEKKDQRTDAQRQAIHAVGCSICVAAGAGSGKTFVLVERYLELVRQGADPREVLTITFTEKAAREMRERIGAALGPAQSALEGAWISTIHGFCARLLRTYSVEADVDPAFQVLTELPQARVRRAAFAEAQAAFRAEWPEAYDAIVDRVRWGHDQEGFAGIDLRVFALHEAQRAAGERPRALAAGERPARFDAVDVALVQAAAESLAAALRAYEQAFAAHPRASVAARSKLDLVRDRARSLANLGAAPFDPQVHSAIGGLVRSVRGNGLFRDERVAVAEALDALARAYVEGPARAVGAALDDLVARFDATYRARKARLAALDFGDLEERARDLLERRPDVAEDVRRRFRAILIDEFQDTSRLQQKIVDLVRRPGAFFAVGDVKQAVYGFRHAEVRGLLEVEDEVRRTGGLVIPLDTSFRTRPSVLAYVDAVFQGVFGEPGSEVPHQPLRAAESVAFAPKNVPSVEVVLAHAETLELGRAAEARAIAARLASVVEGKLLEGTNPLRKDSFGKPLRYKDCAILFRAMTELATYERALRERGVPYRVDRGGGFFEAPEVVDALNVLRCVASEKDDLALAAVLRSPAAGLSDDALVGLARFGASEVPRRGLAAALERLREEPDELARGLRGGAPEIGPDQGARALELARVLGELRALKGRTSARDLLERALEGTGLADASLVRNGNARGLGNLRKLLAIVEELEADPALGLEDVIFALEDLRASAAREAEVSLSGGDEDAVALLTVHAAKGLEWPLVVVADLGRSDNPWAEPVAWSAETGCVPVFLDPSSPFGRIEPLAYTRLFERKKVREREESKRLLYVAMTRARDHLVLAGARGGQRDAGPWLAWSLQPLHFGAAPLAVEADEAMGATARVLPGPDENGVRLVQLGASRAEDEVGAEAGGALDEGPGPAGSGRARVATGPLGPEAGARTLLDETVRERIRQGLPPTYEREHGPSEADRAEAATALARALRPLPPVDLGGSLYVVTEVLAYESCPRLYLYEHVLGARAPGDDLGASLGADEPRSASGDDEPPLERPDAFDPSSIARHVLGTVAHRVLELGSGRTPARVREILVEETGGLSSAALGAASRLVLEWVAGFERSPLGRRAAEARQVLREEPFLVHVPLPDGLEPVLLRGTADLVFKDGGGAVLVDYKTNDLTPLEVPAKAVSYALQLQLYALAVSESLGEPVREAWLSFLAADQAVSVDVSASALDAARARLAAFVVARRRGEFPPRPGSLCRSCAFRSVCPGAALLAPGAPRP
jgi:ATP-dependent exoDNAse (exonuclease V) beta subunit